MNWSYLAVTTGEKEGGGGVTNSPAQEPMRAHCIAQGHDDGACDVLSFPPPRFSLQIWQIQTAATFRSQESFSNLQATPALEYLCNEKGMR